MTCLRGSATNAIVYQNSGQVMELSSVEGGGFGLANFTSISSLLYRRAWA